MAFEVRTIPYRTRLNQDVVLRCDRYNGHKVFWVETPKGRRITPRYFYNEHMIQDILDGAKEQRDDQGTGQEAGEDAVRRVDGGREHCPDGVH